MPCCLMSNQTKIANVVWPQMERIGILESTKKANKEDDRKKFERYKEKVSSEP